MEHQIELQQLTGFVMKNLTAEACSRKSLLVNNVTPGIIVHADREALAETLTDVLTKTICHTESNCIRIEAVAFDNIISLVIKQTGSCSSSNIAVSMAPLQPLANKLGGSISVVTDNNSRITVALSFYNGRRAA
jgi:hypothetical protein